MPLLHFYLSVLLKQGLLISWLGFFGISVNTARYFGNILTICAFEKETLIETGIICQTRRLLSFKRKVILHMWMPVNGYFDCKAAPK